MLSLYGVLLRWAVALLPRASKYNPKFQRLLAGRVGLLDEVVAHYASVDPKRKRIIIHVASFGELEQAKPVIERLKAQDSSVHIHLTFFSPSGYDNTLGKYQDADFITYLPFDTKEEVKNFLDASNPSLFIFVRYDVWHQLANELKRRGIRTVLIAATFDRNKLLNPVLRPLYRKTYQSLSAISAIREADYDGLIQAGVDPAVLRIGGDTRFDRVIERKANVERLPDALPEAVLSAWKTSGRLTLVAGSTWEPDEKLLREVVDTDAMSLVIVPHEVNKVHIEQIMSQYGTSAVRLSEISNFSGQPVVVVDSIGALFGLYRYADMAYIGGGFGAGVHNTLEAAVWGLPIICGPKIERSKEIEEMRNSKAALVISNPKDLRTAIEMLSAGEIRIRFGESAAAYVQNNAGAIDRIMSMLST